MDKGYFLTLVMGETWLGPSMNLLQLAQRDSVRGRGLTQLAECSLTMLETCRYFCWLEGKMLYT